MDTPKVSFNSTSLPTAQARDDITKMLKTIREVSKLNENKETTSEIGSNFQTLLEKTTQAVNEVNRIETQATQTKEAYLSGAPGISMTDVVIASQKSSVAFQALLSVRNKLLEAYQRIMDMPV